VEERKGGREEGAQGFNGKTNRGRKRAIWMLLPVGTDKTETPGKKRDRGEG
jgi:hypothetical protein